MNYAAIADAALARASELLPRWLPGGRWEGNEYVVCNPTRADHSPGSFKINRLTGKAADFAIGWNGGDLIAVRALVDRCSQPEAAKRLADELGIDTDSHVTKPASNNWQPIMPIPADAPPPPEQHPKHGKPTIRYQYRDKDGSTLFWIYRFEFFDVVKKEFVPVSYGKDGWRFKGVPTPRPLYNLHLITKYPDATVVVCEGEKAADAASQLLPLPEYVVTTSPNGANSAGKADWTSLTGRRVVIWPDNDEPGRNYACTVAGKLSGCKTSVIDPVVFRVHKEGWDAADALAENISPETVQQVIANSKIEQSSNATRSPYKVITGKSGTRDGVYYHGKNNDGEALPPFRVCSPLTITARTNNGEGHNWGYLLEWPDPDGKPHSWAMPAELLAGLGDEYRRELLNGGLEITPDKKAKSLLTTYIQSANTDKRARCTDKTGWHNSVFVLPDKTLGETGERVLYQSSAIAKHCFKQQGTLEEWQQNVSKPIIGNSRAVFALSCAFAPALLNAANEESGGFHFRGESSCGKTTLLKLAASVWGNPEYVQRWRATSNGLEGTAQLHNDCLLILDELAQVEPKEAGEIAYMLGNGSGKVRASKEGMARKAARWRLLYLSAGEIGLADHVRVSGKETKAGQEIRLADIPADAGKGMGVFEQIHGDNSPANFSRSLCDAVAKYYGIAGIEFLESLLANLHVLPEWIAGEHKKLVRELLPISASGQVERVAARFAIVGIAGELATHFEITGWEKGEAETAAKVCFQAWLEARGGAGNLEATKLLSDIRAALEAHSESRFTVLGKDDSSRPTINRMGFIREEEPGEREYIILRETFRRELCRGYDPTKAAKTLAEFGILIPDSDGKLQKRESLPGMPRTRCYVLRGSKLWEAEHGS